ncbi:hypothetical protein [Bacteroides sp. 224]|uniref:hypothetical protein n=1 Tax=Bacteroides sp. 224 TaxID=2302936 RepID=UPI0013D2825C|nr:hypothetical protein [Bacteroides sp. 224]NDV67086.1 hypothetical protein [Bacteroides sp. 224]
MKDSVEQGHLVRVTQLICIRKNIEGNHSAAYLTFIPSKDYYSTHKNRIIDIFLENKEDYYGDFTGRVIYSDLVTSQLMAIDKVANGKFEWGFSRKNTPEIEDFKFNFLEMFKDISIFGVIGTRTNLDGGELEEVQCVYCTKCNKQVEPNHRCPADGNNSSGWNYGDSSGDNNYGGGSNGNWGDWGSSGSGGTGSSGNNGNGQNTNSPQDPAFEMLIIQLKYHLDKKGMNTGKYKVVKGIECSAYARVIDEKIEICQLFAEKEFKDQVAILGHEIYHNENDDNSWVREVKPLPFQLQLKLPPEHEKYVREYLVEKEMQYYPEELRNEEREKTYNDMTKYNFIKDPRYYQNEINAYTWEINTFMDVTPEYDAERRYRLWEYTQLKPYADQYHR